ncbi:MAG: hypothetical protein SGI84_05030 [Gemmatimonadota bacterium]|nr:hypothetical protein [Gemmatimonadota bacterium]
MIFLAVALGVSSRQRSGFAVAASVDSLQTERRDLEAQAADLEQRIRTASARGVLDARVARSHGLQMPGSHNSATLDLSASPTGRP